MAQGSLVGSSILGRNCVAVRAHSVDSGAVSDPTALVEKLRQLAMST